MATVAEEVLTGLALVGWGLYCMALNDDVEAARIAAFLSRVTWRRRPGPDTPSPDAPPNASGDGQVPVTLTDPDIPDTTDPDRQVPPAPDTPRPAGHIPSGPPSLTPPSDPSGTGRRVSGLPARPVPLTPALPPPGPVPDGPAAADPVTPSSGVRDGHGGPSVSPADTTD